MLYYTTIESSALELLKKLQELPGLKNTFLVVGTALALQLGHRKSVDLDLFGEVSIDSLQLVQELSKVGKTIILKNSANIHIFSVDGIKVDVVNYSYPWLEEYLDIDGIRLAGLRDICAMKLAAVTGRGTKKDFIDIYFLLQHFSMREIQDFYAQKYTDGSWFSVLKSLSYFEDAEAEPMPFMLKSLNWPEVKEFILNLLVSL